MAYYDFLSIIFAPLIKISPLLTIFTVSFIFSLVTLMVTKYTTDQSLLKRIREQTKEYRNEIKELRKDPSRAKEMQEKMLQMNKLAFEQMKHSFKPLIITSLPIILLLIPWMNAVFAYEGIKPQQEFTATALFEKNINGEAILTATEGLTIIGDNTKKIENGRAEWELKGSEGEHLIEVVYGDEKHQHSILISKNSKYSNPIKKTDGAIKLIKINYKKLIILPIGYRDWFGWLGTYIIFSIIFTMIFRKIIKVY